VSIPKWKRRAKVNDCIDAESFARSRGPNPIKRMTRDSKTTSTPRIKDDFKEYNKNMRNENGIMLSFRWISWH
jgi:hypothetical protein